MIEDFILEHDNFFNYEECKKYIDFFEYVSKCGLTHERSNLKHEVSDNCFTFHELNFKEITYDLLNLTPEYSNLFLQRFWETSYEWYSKKYSTLNKIASHQIYTLKVQKTLPGEGYHLWHAENTNKSLFNRFLTFILYLNDVEQGGETEFLYYPKRIAPKAGKLILFPGSFTHTHRGNQPLSGEKYVLTGWVYFNE